MTTTLATMSRSNEGKRNRKTKALNALLSATALGLFLEGCGTPTTGDEISQISRYVSNGVATCMINYEPVSCDDSRIINQFGPIASASALGVEGAELSAEAGESGGDQILEGSSDTDTLDGGEGIDTVSYANSEEGVEVDLSAGKGEKGDAEGDILLNIENLVGSTQDDTLIGNTRDNAIEGTSGNDILKGGAGADTYIFSEGDGEDTVVEVAEEGVVNTLRFEGDYEASDFSFERSSEDAKDLVVIADTDGDGEAENEVTLEGYFTSETSSETAYSIVVQINDEEAFVPSLQD